MILLVKCMWVTELIVTIELQIDYDAELKNKHLERVVTDILLLIYVQIDIDAELKMKKVGIVLIATDVPSFFRY